MVNYYYESWVPNLGAYLKGCLILINICLRRIWSVDTKQSTWWQYASEVLSRQGNSPVTSGSTDIFGYVAQLTRKYPEQSKISTLPDIEEPPHPVAMHPLQNRTNGDVLSCLGSGTPPSY